MASYSTRWIDPDGNTHYFHGLAKTTFLSDGTDLEAALRNKANGRNVDGMVTLFVAVNGTDQNDGSESFPYRTIGRAIEEAQRYIATDGVVILIGDGEYQENIVINNLTGLSIGSKSGDRDKVLLRGKVAGTVVGVYASTAITLNNLSLVGFSENRNGLIYSKSSVVEVRKCRLTNTGSSGVTFGMSSNNGFIYAEENEINNTDQAFLCDGALMWTLNNTGTGNGTGAYAKNGIITRGGTKPEAATDMVELLGGRVFD